MSIPSHKLRAASQPFTNHQIECPVNPVNYQHQLDADDSRIKEQPILYLKYVILVVYLRRYTTMSTARRWGEKGEIY